MESPHYGGGFWAWVRQGASPDPRAPQPESISCPMCDSWPREEVGKGLGVLPGHRVLNSRS